MKYKRYLILLVLSVATGRLCAQSSSISLTPAGISPSSYNMTVTTAGSSPTNPLVNNYTSQLVKYSWPFFGDNIYGTMYVSSSSIPLGITVTVIASSSTSGGSGFGKGTADADVKTVNSSMQTLVTRIWQCSGVSRTLTQNIFIGSFADLHPGTYPVTITYYLQ